jgi:DNA-binding response OmpR family regulator
MTINALQEKREEKREKGTLFMGVQDIHWNTERHVVVIQERIIPLTATEYQLLFPLRGGVPVTYEDLTAIVYKGSVDAKVRVMLDKHIDRIRGKLRGSGVYVYCVLGYGYLLLPEHWPNRCA